MAKPQVIDIDEHALLRAEERGRQYGLNYIETNERIFSTVKRGGLAKRKHLSKTGKTYYHYFQDNVAFYVIGQEKEYQEYMKILIRTIIIEEGRE